MQERLTTRKGTTADIPFLAGIEYEACLPPHNHCFWEDLLEGTGTEVLPFIEMTFKTGASNWGGPTDFLILEEAGKPVAAAANYQPKPPHYGPFRLSHLDRVARALNWSEESAAAFRDRYVKIWGDERAPLFLMPIAPFIIEYVAVVPEARGRGLGKALIRALLEEGRSQQYSHAGITVLQGNDAALHTYTSLGFKPYITFHTDYFSEQYNVSPLAITKLGYCFH